MKILIIAGHGAGDPGAIGNSYKECTLTRHFAENLKNQNQYCAYDLDLALYPISKNCYEESKKGNAPDWKQYDYVLELHFNSFTTSDPFGSEIYISESETGDSVERAILDVCTTYGFLNRGVKRRDDLLNLNLCKAAGVSYALFEICFISNAGDVSRYTKTAKDLALGVLNAIGESFGCEKKEEKLYCIQVGAFRDRQNAVNYKKEIEEKLGITAFLVEKNGG